MITASTINQIINHISVHPFFKGYCFALTKDPFMSEELFQEFNLKICEEPIEKMLRLFNSGEFHYYSVAIIKNMIYNEYSELNKNHRNNNLVLNDEIETSIPFDDESNVRTEEIERLIKDINKFLIDKTESTKGYWYNKQLFELYFNNNHTYRSIGELTKIPYTSIFHSIRITKEEIQKEFKTRYEQLKNK